MQKKNYDFATGSNGTQLFTRDFFEVAHRAIDQLRADLLAEKTTLVESRWGLDEAWKAFHDHAERTRKEDEAAHEKAAEALGKPRRFGMAQLWTIRVS